MEILLCNKMYLIIIEYELIDIGVIKKKSLIISLWKGKNVRSCACLVTVFEKPVLWKKICIIKA